MRFNGAVQACCGATYDAATLLTSLKCSTPALPAGAASLTLGVAGATQISASLSVEATMPMLSTIQVLAQTLNLELCT